MGHQITTLKKYLCFSAFEYVNLAKAISGLVNNSGVFLRRGYIACLNRHLFYEKSVTSIRRPRSLDWLLLEANKC